MSIKIKVRDYLAVVDAKLDKSIDRNLPEPVFKGHAAPEPTIHPVIKSALLVILNHVEPGWENCTTLVSAWLNENLSSGDEASTDRDRIPSPPSQNPWSVCYLPTPEQKPRELWLLPPDDLCRHWTVTDKEPTSVGWIHVQVLEGGAEGHD